MRIKNVINNNQLESELKHVDIKSTPEQNINNGNSEDDNKKIIKKYIKFNISSIDTQLYYNQLAIIGLYTVICLISLLAKDFLSLVNPLIMFGLVVLLSSNPIQIFNNRFIDVGMWNLINCFNILIKGLNLSKINNEYETITDIFTKLFIGSLLLSGYPAFNSIFVIIFIGLLFSYLLCFINKDINAIKESGKNIENKELSFTVISSLLFALAFKGNVANGTIFAAVILLKYFQHAIAELEINEINQA